MSSREKSSRHRSRSRERERDRDRDRERPRERERDRDRERRRSTSRSRDKSRRRSRSKSRDRRRSRSRSRDRARSKPDDSSNIVAVLQQQQLQRQLLLQQQQMFLQQQTASTSGPNQGGKKQREVYVGNLAIGVVNEVTLREMFNAALAGLVPDPVTNPPVANVNIDPSGRYAFVELRTEELATSAVQLDKMEVAGRIINVGRPKGYIEPPQGPAQTALVGQAQLFAAQLSGGATNVVLLEDLLPAKEVRDPRSRMELIEDVSAECQKCGKMEGLAVPLPPAYLPDTTPCRVYVKFASIQDAQKCKDMNNGRLFDERKITAAFTTDVDFKRAFGGEWIVQLPGLVPGQLVPTLGI